MPEHMPPRHTDRRAGSGVEHMTPEGFRSVLMDFRGDVAEATQAQAQYDAAWEARALEGEAAEELVLQDAYRAVYGALAQLQERYDDLAQLNIERGEWD